jgi:hypothetical protein
MHWIACLGYVLKQGTKTVMPKLWYLVLLLVAPCQLLEYSSTRVRVLYCIATLVQALFVLPIAITICIITTNCGSGLLQVLATSTTGSTHSPMVVTHVLSTNHI